MNVFTIKLYKYAGMLIKTKLREKEILGKTQVIFQKFWFFKILKIFGFQKCWKC